MSEGGSPPVALTSGGAAHPVLPVKLFNFLIPVRLVIKTRFFLGIPARLLRIVIPISLPPTFAKRECSRYAKAQKMN